MSYKQWHAVVAVGGGNISLGYFATADDAARAHDRACLVLKPVKRFVSLNFPESDYADEVLPQLPGERVQQVASNHKLGVPVRPTKQLLFLTQQCVAV